MGYHAVNVFLHTVVCVMFYIMCKIFLRTRSSFVASMLFAVHPIHTEAASFPQIRLKNKNFIESSRSPELLGERRFYRLSSF